MRIQATVFLLAILTSCAPARPAPRALAGDAQEQPLFELRSGFWLNLHHFLRSTSRQGDGSGTDAATAAERAALASLSRHDRQAWAEAVEHYRREATARPLFDGTMIDLKNRLAGWHGTTLDGAGMEPAWAAALQGAAPAYRAVWWPAHDALNRAWIEDMAPLLHQHGSAIARGVTRAYRTPWPTQPIPVDVSAFVEWPGAYTTVRPAHIVMTSAPEQYTGTLGLEMLFHEALHTLDDSVATTFARFSAELQVADGPEVLHALLFYTAGEVVRQTIADHVPYIQAKGLTERGSLAPHFPVIEQCWGPYLRTEASMTDALGRLMGAIARRPRSC